MTPPADRTEYSKLRDERERNGSFIPLSALTSTDTGSSSEWGLLEILVFRVIFKHQDKNKIPRDLDTHFQTALARVVECETLLQCETVLFDGIRRLSQRKMREHGFPLPSFFCYLKEVMEQPPVTDGPDRSMRNTRTQSLPEEDVMMSSSPPEPLASSFGSRTSDPRPAERVANALVLEFLQSLAPLVLHSDTINLEWAIAPDTFHIWLPNGDNVTVINDGSLVERKLDALGNLTRWSEICYASIESKVDFDYGSARTTPDSAHGQHVAQLISLIRQVAQTRPVFLITATRNYLWIIQGMYTEAYRNFLNTGNESEEPFLTVREYGPFNLAKPEEFRRAAALSIAVVDYLQEISPFGL